MVINVEKNGGGLIFLGRQGQSTGVLTPVGAAAKTKLIGDALGIGGSMSQLRPTRLTHYFGHSEVQLERGADGLARSVITS